MIHVYEIPLARSNGYCFGGPVPIVFGNVDWFKAKTPMGRTATAAELEAYVKSKLYYRKDRQYLVLSDIEGLTFMINRSDA